MPRSLRFALPILLVATTACESDLVCTAEARFGVNISVRNAVTQQPVLQGVRGALHEGSYVDSLQLFTDIEGNIHYLAGALQRAGTYRIELVAGGYQNWSRSNVRVTADRCGVTTVSVTADLVPAGS
jgi:hypothetical protein